jgi:hypothetical protein
LISDPQRLLHGFGHLQKHSQLNRAGILKLVYHQKVEPLAQPFPDFRPPQQLKGQRLLIGEIDQATIAFELRKALESFSRTGKRLRDKAFQIVMKPRVCWVAVGLRDDRRDKGLGRLGRVQLRESCPVVPG